MKDKSSGDACPNGNHSAPSPVRQDAKRKCHQASQYSNFDKVRSHRLVLPIQGAVLTAPLLRFPRIRSARSANGPKIKAMLSQAAVDLPRSRAISYAAGIEAIETS